MLLTDRFLNSHRLFHRDGVAFLIPGLWSTTVACSEFQMFSAHHTEAVGCWAYQQRAMWPWWDRLVGFFSFCFSRSFDQRENLMTCHLILLKFPVISVMNRLFGVMMVLRKLHYCRIRGEEIACSDMSPRCVFGSYHQLLCFYMTFFESIFVCISLYSSTFIFRKYAIKLKWIGSIQLNPQKIKANKPKLASDV